MTANETDPGRRGWIAFVRMFLGAFWLYEITLGKHWKIGFPGAGPRPGWVGVDAGSRLTHFGERAIAQGVDPWFATLLEGVVLPYAPTWAWIITVAQAGIGIALLVGFRTRWFALAGVGMSVALAYIGSIRSGALIVGHGALLLGAAGRGDGVDGWVRSRGIPATGWPEPPRWSFPRLAAAGSLVAIYYVFRVPTETAARQVFKSIELVMLFALSSVVLIALYLGAHRLELAGDVLRIYVGWAFLHEIFVRDTSGITSLPGLATGPELHAVFEEIAASHATVVARVVEAGFSPFSAYWAALFGAVQLLVGLALLTGWRVRRTSLVGMGFLGLLLALGYIKLVPYLLAYLVGAYGLGGRYVSLDGATGTVSRPTFPDLGAGHLLGVALVAVGLAAVALRVGVYPGARAEALDIVVPVYVAIFVAVFGAAGWGRSASDP